MDQRQDQELIAAYRAGDESALHFLIQKHVGSVHRFLTRLTGDEHLAEELTQDTFLKVWKRQGAFDLTKPFRPWLFTIARRTAIDELRKKRALPFSHVADETLPDLAESIPDDQPLPDAWLLREETTGILNDELQKLPLLARTILLLHETEDLTFDHIAEIMGEPMNTVKSRYRRALITLKKALTERFSQP